MDNSFENWIVFFIVRKAEERLTPISFHCEQNPREQSSRPLTRYRKMVARKKYIYWNLMPYTNINRDGCKRMPRLVSTLNKCKTNRQNIIQITVKKQFQVSSIQSLVPRNMEEHFEPTFIFWNLNMEIDACTISTTHQAS